MFLTVSIWDTFQDICLKDPHVYTAHQDFFCAVAFYVPGDMIVVIVMNSHDFGVEFKLEDGEYYASCYIPERAIQTYRYKYLGNK